MSLAGKLVLTLAVLGGVWGQTGTPTALTPAESSAAVSASAAAATASTSSHTSNVQGAAFNNFYQIWLENTDYDKAFSQTDLAFLATQGILLTNYYALTHPSEPNYVSVVGGDYFGIGDDNLHAIPQQVASVVDILEEAGISWAEYEEDMPYTGFQGFNYTNPATDYVDYVRKHNPLVIYDSVSTNPARLSNIKNFTLFNSDLAAKTLPQWAFFTPNMLNDGHDTTVDYAGNWTRSFVTPLLNNTTFMNKTLVLITFDENETYTIKNNVWALLLGDVIPPSLRGTTDNTFYTHYSTLSTVQNNWGLYNLGRGDVVANFSNVFQFVANATKYTGNVVVAPADIPYNNFTSSGYFDTANEGPIPAVNETALGAGGKGILPSLKGTNGSAIPPPVSSASATGSGTAVASGASGSASAAASGSKSAAVRQFTYSYGEMVGLLFAIAAFTLGLVV